MALNAKSHMISLFGHCGKTIADASVSFNINGWPMRALSQKDTWTYLGNEFAAEKRNFQPPDVLLSPYLQILIKPSLKPQQCLCALKTIVLPKLYHHVAADRTTVSELTRVSRMVRASIRQWFILSNKTSTEYFHAPIGGGLGIPTVR